MSGKRILIVDDEPDVRDILSTRFEMEGCEVEIATNGNAALESIKSKRYHIVISDVGMPGYSGLELLDRIQTRSPRPSVILISGCADLDVDEMVNRGAETVLVKPFDLEDILAAARHTLSKSRDC